MSTNQKPKAKLVQHRSPERNSAIAPYNFVPLPEKVMTVESASIPSCDSYKRDKRTGYIELIITAETPLYVRCAFPSSVWSDRKYRDRQGNLARYYFDSDKPKATGVRECQDFFHHGDPSEPVIPGSSLRGMTRALVEVFSYAKVSGLSDSHLVHRAVADTSSLGDKYRERMLGPDKNSPNKHFDYPSRNLKGGYLERQGGNCFIRPALEPNSLAESFVHVEYDMVNDLIGLASGRGRHKADQKVYVEPVARRTTAGRGQAGVTLDLAVTPRACPTPQPGLVPATLVESGHMGQEIGQPRKAHDKHMHCAIYEPDPDDSRLIAIDRKVWKLYEEDRDMTRGIEPRQLRDTGDPLFYLLDANETLVFFGPTMMFRLPYANTIHDFIPSELVDSSKLDMAEAIFGTVNEQSNTLVAGRVFFTDATWNPKSANTHPFLDGDNDGRRIPKILSSPKPTSFQLYLTQPEPNHTPPQWYIVSKESIERMTANGVQEDVLTRVEKLKGQEFGSESDFIQALVNSGFQRVQLFANGNELLRAIKLHTTHELRSYYDVGEAVLRGSKRYWHKRDLSRDEMADDFVDAAARIRRDEKGVESYDQRARRWKDSSQHTIIRPVRKGTEFIGRVYFENLADEELGALIVTLELEKSKRHQIGMAKPLGLGAVRIAAKLFVQKRRERYARLLSDEQTWCDEIEDQNESDRIKEDCRQRFADKVLRFFNDTVLSPKCSALEQIPRLQALRALLEFEADRYPERKCYLGLGTRDEQREWRRRHVLPHAQAVDQDGEPTPVVLANVSSNSGKASPTAPSSQTVGSTTLVQRAASPDLKRGEEVKRRITALRSPGEVSLVAGIVQKIESISAVSVRLDCAQEMKRWLERNKFWNNPKHAEKDWHKSLQAMLDVGSSTLLE